jgi:hypothetical protein
MKPNDRARIANSLRQRSRRSIGSIDPAWRVLTGREGPSLPNDGLIQITE